MAIVLSLTDVEVGIGESRGEAQEATELSDKTTGRLLLDETCT